MVTPKEIESISRAKMLAGELFPAPHDDEVSVPEYRIAANVIESVLNRGVFAPQPPDNPDIDQLEDIAIGRAFRTAIEYRNWADSTGRTDQQLEKRKLWQIPQL